MADLCLLPNKVEQFKKDLKEGKISLPDLLAPTMTSEARTAIFAKYANPEDAKVINTLFESKLVLKNRIIGIQNLFSKLGEFGKNSPEKQAELASTLSEYKAAQQKQIFSPTEQETFLNDFADKKAKSHVTLEQAKMIDKLSNDIKIAQDTTKAKLSGVSDEYLKAVNTFNNYVANLQPLGSLNAIGRNLVIIGRNHLLINPATPIKTTFNQITNTIVEGMGRKLAFASIRGANPKLARQANGEAWKTFRTTGNNTAAMENINDNRLLGTGKGVYKAERFRVPTGTTKGMGLIERPIRAYAKLTNKIAINIEHNISFTKFYQKTFFDMANIVSGDLAKHEGLKGIERKARAAEIFKDAVKIEPQTKEGKMIRGLSQKQAARVTSTNDTWASELALAGKNALNKITPGFPLGDLLVPIAKIPANIVANGILNAGVGIPVAVKDIFQGRQKMQSENMNTKYEGAAQFGNGIQRLMATAATLAIAAWLTSQLTKKDFKSDQYGAHFVKIGNTWINTEYFSIISPALGGMMLVKEKGNIAEYPAGVMQSTLALPVSGVEALSTIFKTGTKGIITFAGSFVTSRGIPAFISKLTGARPLEQLLFGAHGVKSETEVKQDTANVAAKAKATRDNTLADWSTSTSAHLTQFHAKVGDAKFQAANDKFNLQYASWLKTTQAKQSYKNLSQTEQKALQTSSKASIEAKILKSYGFKYKAAKPNSALKTLKPK